MYPARKSNLLLFVCGWKIPRAAENGNIAAQRENTSIVWKCSISFKIFNFLTLQRNHLVVGRTKLFKAAVELLVY